MSAYLPSAWQKALEIAQSARLLCHVINDTYLYETDIDGLIIIAGLHANANQLAEATLGQAAIARIIGGNFAGGLQ